MKPMKPMTPMAPMKPMEPMKPMDDAAWWPAELGRPNSAGAQNQRRYAYFGDTHRLAVQQGDGPVRLYDTGRHRIQGFAQQQGDSSASLTFSGEDGPITLESLTPL